MVQQPAAKINVKRLETIIKEWRDTERSSIFIAKRIIDEFSVLRPHQQTSESDGSSRIVIPRKENP
jgi:hypothetical protein